MIAVYILLGLFAGALIGFFYARTRQMSVADPEKQHLISQTATQEKELSDLRNTHLANARTIASQEEQIKNLEILKAQQKEDNSKEQQRLQKEFQLVAAKILDENSEKFTKQNKANIDSVLTPLKEKIKEFEEKVDATHRRDNSERVELKVELENLLKMNQQLSSDAKNLTTALKGENKTQGNWGEMVLEKILENSGLRQGVEYDVQHSVQGEEGQRLQPDIVVKLPDNKHIIVDSKVSLVAYERLVNADDEENRQRYLKEHLLSIRTHIKSLSEKSYQTAVGIHSPDFVLLFLPIESSFGVALSSDVELYNYAWSRKIVIVSPSTLLATLRTISSVWKQEHQNRNVLEIARLAGTLYDKFVGFAGDMDKIEAKLSDAQSAYGSAKEKLISGKGNIMSIAQKTKKLGVKSKREFIESWASDETPGLQTNMQQDEESGEE
jgi:DNA recombination protein RmuC